MASQFSRTLIALLLVSATVHADPYKWGRRVGCVSVYALLAGAIATPIILMSGGGVGSRNTPPLGEKVEPYLDYFILIPADFPKGRYVSWAEREKVPPIAESLLGFARYLNERLYGGLELTMRKVGKAPMHLLDSELSIDRGTSIEKAYFLYHVLKVLAVEYKAQPPKFVLMLGTPRTDNAIRSQFPPDTEVSPDTMYGLVEFGGETFFPALGIFGPSTLVEKDFVRFKDEKPILEK